MDIDVKREIISTYGTYYMNSEISGFNTRVSFHTKNSSEEVIDYEDGRQGWTFCNGDRCESSSLSAMKFYTNQFDYEKGRQGWTFCNFCNGDRCERPSLSALKFYTNQFLKVVQSQERNHKYLWYLLYEFWELWFQYLNILPYQELKWGRYWVR